ncbi:MAG: hypothetical protein HZA89_05595 [Verrucomicrobia bacterium]|nr:hypothetical protein [Verrucomicrobiota bacterium]
MSRQRQKLKFKTRFREIDSVLQSKVELMLLKTLKEESTQLVNGKEGNTIKAGQSKKISIVRDVESRLARIIEPVQFFAVRKIGACVEQRTLAQFRLSYRSGKSQLVTMSYVRKLKTPLFQTLYRGNISDPSEDVYFRGGRLPGSYGSNQ